MQINYPTIKHHLKNVMFINGTAYAGKSTMVRMLADAYSLVHCGENYDCVPEGVLTPEKYPNLCYFQTKRDWSAFLNRTPDEYNDWIVGCSREMAEFEITYLISIAKEQRVIVDTNIPLEILQEIADDHQVAVMLAPQSMSVEHFFHRDDPEKVFLREQIALADDPEKTMTNYRACLAKINSQENYDKWANSGFFTLVREDTETDTKEKTMAALAKHFRLM